MRTATTRMDVQGLLYINDEDNTGTQRVYRFDNNYGASVIRYPRSYGGNQGLWELAAIRFYGPAEDDWEITYDTVTGDVAGYLAVEDVNELLEEIRAMPGEPQRASAHRPLASALASPPPLDDLTAKEIWAKVPPEVQAALQSESPLDSILDLFNQQCAATINPASDYVVNRIMQPPKGGHDDE